MWNSTRPLPSALLGLLCCTLLACAPAAPEGPSGPPGSGTTYGDVEGPCDPETAFIEAAIYAPVQADIDGDWSGWAGWPVTWTFDGTTVTRYDEINGGCWSPDNCMVGSGGTMYAVHTGTFKLKNALVLMDWGQGSQVPGVALNDLFYALKECTGKVWLMGSSPATGEVQLEKM